MAKKLSPSRPMGDLGLTSDVPSRAIVTRKGASAKVKPAKLLSRTGAKSRNRNRRQ